MVLTSPDVPLVPAHLALPSFRKDPGDQVFRSLPWVLVLQLVQVGRLFPLTRPVQEFPVLLSDPAFPLIREYRVILLDLLDPPVRALPAALERRGDRPFLCLPARLYPRSIPEVPEVLVIPSCLLLPVDPWLPCGPGVPGYPVCLVLLGVPVVP